MITTTGQVPGRWAKVKSGYAQWEHRNAARFAAWSVGRRWATFVLLPTVLVCGGVTVFGMPLAWVIRGTNEASRGAPSPDAAADEYLMALSYNNEDGLLPLLDNDNQDTLLSEWRAYRAAMSGTTPPPFKLEYGPLSVGPIIDGRAEVSADVAATWWGENTYRSAAHKWRFTTREDNGWQVAAVDPFVWCGGYVRQDVCP